MVAYYQIVANRNARLAQGGNLFQKTRGVNDHSVGDDRTYVRLKNARRQERELVCFSRSDYGVPGIGTTVVTNDNIVLIGKEIDDFPLGLVAPLQADDTRTG